MTDAKNEAACGASRSDAGLGADFDNAEERYLRETLAMLQEIYAKAAKPYIDRLVAIQAMKPPPPMIVTREQAKALGFKVPNAQVVRRGAAGGASERTEG